MAPCVGPWVGFKILGEVVEQVMDVDALRTIASHLNGDRVRGLLRHLKQLDQTFDQLEFNQSGTGGIQQRKRFTRLDFRITNLQSEQQAPITGADRAITKVMGIDGTSQSLTMKMPSSSLNAGDDLINSDP